MHRCGRPQHGGRPSNTARSRTPPPAPWPTPTTGTTWPHASWRTWGSTVQPRRTVCAGNGTAGRLPTSGTPCAGAGTGNSGPLTPAGRVVRAGAQDTNARVPQCPTLRRRRDKRPNIPHHSTTAGHRHTPDGRRARKGPLRPFPQQRGSARTPTASGTPGRPPQASGAPERHWQAGGPAGTGYRDRTPPAARRAISHDTASVQRHNPTDTSVDRHRPHTTHNAGPRGHEWPGLEPVLSSRPKGHGWRGQMHRPVQRTSPCQGPTAAVLN